MTSSERKCAKISIFSVFSLLQKGCHGNGAISAFALFCSSITQFLNSEILSFHLMNDAASGLPPVGVTPKLSHFLGLYCYTMRLLPKQLAGDEGKWVVLITDVSLHNK